MTTALSPGLQRILARQPEVIRRAVELRAVLGDPTDSGATFCFRSAQSRLVMADGSLHFELAKPPPCAWWRFWQWALLGWRWVDLRKANE